MSNNKNLTKAKAEQDNEWYTKLYDIEQELNHYLPYFEGKTILCNCDDPFESNFYKYFFGQMKHLDIKRLICTSYGTSKVVNKQMTLDGWQSDKAYDRRLAYVIDIKREDFPEDDDNAVFKQENAIAFAKEHAKLLKGDGDFRSEECLKYLEEADIVVTNPPFSLWKTFVPFIINRGKKLLCIGPLNARTYKEVFPLIKENKLWPGINQVKTFIKPDGSEMKLGNVGWYTNMDHKKRNEPLVLVNSYEEFKEMYPRYDNYDAIDVSKVSDIPKDYFEEEYIVETKEELDVLLKELDARGRSYTVEEF